MWYSMMTPSNISTNEGSRLRSSQDKDCSSALPDFPRLADASMASDKKIKYQSKVINIIMKVLIPLFKSLKSLRMKFTIVRCDAMKVNERKFRLSSTWEWPIMKCKGNILETYIFHIALGDRTQSAETIRRRKTLKDSLDPQNWNWELLTSIWLQISLPNNYDRVAGVYTEVWFSFPGHPQADTGWYRCNIDWT